MYSIDIPIDLASLTCPHLPSALWGKSIENFIFLMHSNQYPALIFPTLLHL